MTGACQTINTQLLTRVPSVRHRRDPLTLSLSPDGIAFTQAWALRWDCPERRYNGSHKDYGYAYPCAIVDKADGTRGRGKEAVTMKVAYSVNKEDIEVMEFPLSALRGGTDAG